MELTDQLVLITLGNVALLLGVATLAAITKSKHGLKPYDILDNEEARIAHRIHMNTVENSLLFIPMIWLAAFYGNALFAVIAGWVWLAARVMYAYNYRRDPKQRGAFFQISFLAILVLMGTVLYGLIFLG